MAGGVFGTLRFLALLVGCTPALLADRSLENAQRAQEMLGREVWSQVITIRNETRGGVYPRTVHALVFELAGLLWFYTDVNGTQSFSLHQNRLEQEKADFGPLLRDIDAGFRSWVVKERPTGSPGRWLSGELRNGCFIESVAALRQRVFSGEKIESPRLLSYYVDTNTGRRGHTVLAYDVGGRVEIVDPARSGSSAGFARADGGDAMALARMVEGPDIVSARFLPLRGMTEGIAAAAASSAASVASTPDAPKPAS